MSTNGTITCGEGESQSNEYCITRPGNFIAINDYNSF